MWVSGSAGCCCCSLLGSSSCASVRMARAPRGAQLCAREGEGRSGEPGAVSESSPAEGVYLGVALRKRKH